MTPTDRFGDVTLYRGDCRPLLASLADESVDVLVTDPPYGLDFPYASYDDTRDNLRRLVEGFMPDARRVAKRVCVVPGQTQVALYPPADWILSVTWNTTGTFGRYGYSQWMPVLVYGHDLAGFGRVNGLLKSDLITLSGGSGVGFMRENGDYIHPCPKPLNVMKLIIRRVSERGDTVLDPFMGIGTTGKACLQTGRKFVGCEIDPGYYATAAEGLRRVDGDGSLFAGTARQLTFGEGGAP